MSPVARRASAALVAIAAVGACRGSTPGAESRSVAELTPPGHAAFALPPLRERAIEYRFQAPPGTDSTRGPLPMGRTTVTESVMTIDGEPAILQVIAVPERGLVDSLVVRRRDLAPIREHVHVRGRLVGIDYAGRTIHWFEQAPGTAERSGDTTFQVPVFAFNQLEMLVRALSLRPGDAAVVPMLSGTTELELDTLMVESRAPHLVRFADPAVVAHYRLEGGERAVVYHEIVMRDGGARYVRVSY